MKTKKLPLITLKLIALFLLSTTSYSQVGIGTLTPDASAMLHMESTTKGMLAPRMSTVQRQAISNPVNGLLVYDITENAFYFYKANVWTKLDSDTRTNYKLIRSAADLAAELAAGGGSKYLLNTTTLYEINGAIMLAHPIELNNAYIMGLDSAEDKLVRSGGDLFTGNTGGAVKMLTLSGGKVFNLTGSAAQNLILRDLIIASSASVGSISGYGMVFMSVVQYIGNSAGITFTNINQLLISNTGWFANNAGTYETFTGTFDFIQKQGGFMVIDGTSKGINVSSNPIVNRAVLSGVSFSGTSTQYVNRYTSGSYSGYNFNNSWTVDCPGIKLESDEAASANIYYNGGITTGFGQTVNNNNPFNLSGNSNTNSTTPVNMFRTESPVDNRIKYLGKKTRTFQVNATLSVRGTSGVGDFYAFVIRKNGITTLTETNTIMRVNNTSDISSNAISGTVELAPGDYVEIWGQRLVGTGNTGLAVFSLNLSIR